MARHRHTRFRLHQAAVAMPELAHGPRTAWRLRPLKRLLPAGPSPPLPLAGQCRCLGLTQAEDNGCRPTLSSQRPVAAPGYPAVLSPPTPSVGPIPPASRPGICRAASRLPPLLPGCRGRSAFQRCPSLGAEATPASPEVLAEDGVGSPGAGKDRARPGGSDSERRWTIPLSGGCETPSLRPGTEWPA